MILSTPASQCSPRLRLQYVSRAQPMRPIRRAKPPWAKRGHNPGHHGYGMVPSLAAGCIASECSSVVASDAFHPYNELPRPGRDRLPQQRPAGKRKSTAHSS